DLRELVGRGRADALRRAVGALQLRVLALELEELVPEPVELGVRDLRLVEDVVAVEVVVDRVAQLRDASLLWLGLRPRGHRAAPPASGRPRRRPSRAGARPDGSSPRTRRQ